MNPALISGSMTTLVLEVVHVNATFWNALSDVIVEHLKLWSGMRLRIMDDLECGYELCVILTAVGTSVKCWSLKSFLSDKAFLELFFNRIMHAHMFLGMFKT